MAVWQLAGTDAVVPPAGGFNPMMIIFMLGMLGLLFFMQSRGKKQAQARDAFRSQLAIGQRVMTQGGLVGTIVGINEAADTIILDSAGSRCEYMRQGIAKTLDDTAAGAVTGVTGVPGLVPGVPAAPQYGANTTAAAPAAGGFLANALNNLAGANAGPEVSDDELAELDALSREYHELRGAEGIISEPIVLKEVE